MLLEFNEKTVADEASLRLKPATAMLSRWTSSSWPSTICSTRRSPWFRRSGRNSSVLLHMVAQVDRATPVLFLETGKHFPETLRYRDAGSDLGLTDVHDIHPLETEPEGRGSRLAPCG